MSKVNALLEQLQTTAAQAVAAAQREIEERNTVQMAEAQNDLRAIFEDLADELLPTVCKGIKKVDANGALFAVVFEMQSSDLQLGPTTLEWKPGATNGHYSNTFMATVYYPVNGLNNRNECWQNVTPWRFRCDVLPTMRKAFAVWAEAEQQGQAQEAARQAQERTNEIERLTQGWRWAAHKSEKDVMQVYDSLVALGESDLAETKLAEWRQAVAVAAQKEAERQARETAHEAAVAEWRAACKAWAEEWTAKLWEPWYLWKVRYVAMDMHLSAERDEELYIIEMIHTLDEPTDIVKVIGNSRVALVDRVDYFGNVAPGFALASFLDGERVVYTDAKIDDSLAYHRSFFAGGYHVNVPAFVLQDPGPAPVMPGEIEGCANLSDPDDAPF